MNDWDIEHRHALPSLKWLTSWIRSGLLHITLNDLMEFDHAYPGVLPDVDTLVWQIELVKQQVKKE